VILAGGEPAGGHGPAQILHYLLWFWWPHPYAWLAALVLFLAASVVAWLARDRFLLALLALNLVSTAAVTLYAAAYLPWAFDHWEPGMSTDSSYQLESWTVDPLTAVFVPIPLDGSVLPPPVDAGSD